MASRRARLKAVANLPVRRKPSSQESAESAELGKTEENSASSQDENKVKVDETKPTKQLESGIEPDNVAETIENIVSNSEPGGEANKSKEQQSGDCNLEKKTTEEKKDEKKPSTSAGPARFGRRVKPTVCLPVRKERIQAEKDTDKNSASEVKLGNEEIEESESIQAAEKPDANNKKDSNKVLETNIIPASATQSTPNQQHVSTVNQEPNNDKTSNSTLASVDKEIKSPEKSNKISSNVIQSPTKTQRPLFLRPNIDLSFRRTDDYKNVGLSPRIRNISESSNSGSVIMQNIASQTDSQAVDSGRNLASIFKRKRAKSNDLTRKMADARRDFHRRYEKIKPDRSSLRMIDLIFYNPATNPMVSKSKMEKKESESASENDELLAEAKMDEPDAIDNSEKDDYDDDDDIGKMPVPQVKIGLNGEIILDEKSLVIETTDAKKGREDLQNSVPVLEDRGSKMSYYCRKSKKSKDWSDSETKRFYKALNTLGTDFLLMKEIFPNRSRLELKNKFKREEKLNRNLIDKALSNPSEFDMTELEKDLADEKKIEEEEQEIKQQKKAKPRSIGQRVRTKTSFLAREMVESDSEMSNGITPVILNIPSRPIVKLEKQKAKKMKDTDMLYEKLILKKDVKGVEVKTSAPISDPNENISKCNNLNISETVLAARNFKSHRRKSKHVKIDDNAVNEPVESTNLNNDVMRNNDHNECEMAMDLSMPKKISDYKKPIRNFKTGKRKAKPILGKPRNKKKKQEHAVYPPNEEPESSNKGNEKDLIVTKTITDDDFLQLLAANVKCMKESKIKVKVSNTREKKIEVIFDEVTPITAKEIEDQNITVLADCNSTICEEESPASPDDCEKIEIRNAKETSVIVENPNAFKKDTLYAPQKLEEPCKDENTGNVVNNENVMVVINENDEGLTTEYQYMLVEEQEVIETVIVDDVAQNVEIEDEVNVEVEEKNEKPENVQNVAPINTSSIVVCKEPKSESDKKMFLAGLSAGSFVLMASDSPNEQREKRFSMFMISEKSQSDGSSVLSSMPVILPPELVNSLTQEMGCS